ncbi:MAG: U32 family peptidase, partial [Desulfuromonadales bacterium]|nr:U32 family peptidase [Desulfuromonadales bacterium]
MTHKATQQKPELLAPAGSLEAFFAAMEFGADAVYVGLKEFSARAKAKNVNRDELERMIGYAHARQRKVFLTLNTLVKEKELSHLIDVLAAVEAIGIDAVILQDMGVWRLIKRHFPGLEMHASTQLTIHNAAGVRMAERLGFSRAVLARELTLEEIAAIKGETSLDLEHFVHGAHCFSFSGQCSFSSWLGGMSGNRGRCAQPCRRRYHHKGKDGYYFSPNDLSAIDLLPELAAAGVMSFKIEGRMKSAEYVANVIQAYRTVLDASQRDRATAIDTAKDLLKESFGRQPTRGFLSGSSPADMVNPGVHGATGRLIGTVERCEGGLLSFVPRDRVHLGDRLRIQPATDKPGTAFTIRDLRLADKAVNRANAGQRVAVGSPPDKSFRAGDRVYKVSSGKAFNLSQSACRKRLESVTPGEAVVDLTVAMPTPERIELSAACQGLTLARHYTVESFPARERPLSHEVLAKVFGKTGQLPLALGRLECGPLPAVVLPLSRLNALRREFYQELADLVAGLQHEARTDHRRQAMAELAPAGMSPVATPRLAVVLGNLHDLSLLRQQGVDELILPLSPGAGAKLEASSRFVLKAPERILWDLPLAIFDTDWPAFQAEVNQLLELGFRRFRLQNIGQMLLFDGVDGSLNGVADQLDGANGLSLESGYRLFTTNSQAAFAWRELGLSSATLYVEDDRDNLAALLNRETQLPLAVTVYASLPMMV